MFENLVVLEAADHDARMDSNRLGEITNEFARQLYRVIEREFGKLPRWDERIGCKAIRFLLALHHVRINYIIAHLPNCIIHHEQLPVTVQQ